MRHLQSLIEATRARRWAPLLGAAALIALVSGCVIVPAGGYYGGGGHYWHGRDRDWR